MTFGYLQGVNQTPNKFLRFLVSKKSSSKISKAVEQVLFKMRLHQQSTMGDWESCMLRTRKKCATNFHRPVLQLREREMQNQHSKEVVPKSRGCDAYLSDQLPCSKVMSAWQSNVVLPGKPNNKPSHLPAMPGGPFYIPNHPYLGHTQ